MCENPNECHYFQALQQDSCRRASETRKRIATEMASLVGEIELMRDFCNRLYKQGRKMRAAQMELDGMKATQQIDPKRKAPCRQATIVNAEEKAFDDILDEIREESQNRKAKREAAE